MSTEQPPLPDGPIPQGLRTAAGWSWRILAILALVVAALVVIARLEVLFVSLFVALLATALLAPAAGRLRAWGVPRALATGAVLIGSLALVGLVLFLVGRAVVGQFEELREAVTQGAETVRVWVGDRFGMSLEQVGERIREVVGGLGGEGGGITASAFGVASTALEVVAGAGIALFATIFFVHDGPGIWHWVTTLFSGRPRHHVDVAGRQSWAALASYARGTVLIAAIDAVGIGLGVALVGVPLAGSIAVLVFFGSFVPIVGALVSGLVAVLIALATEGPTAALIVAAVVIGVQQLEGHVLQPLIQGRMVALHPLAVVLAVAGGSTVAGLVGAVIAVPVVAVLNVVVRYASSAAREGRAPSPAGPAGVEEDEGDVRVARREGDEGKEGDEGDAREEGAAG